MLPVRVETLRIFLNVLAATVWVGGQLTLAGLVPAVRGIGADAPRLVARRFDRIAWPAYGILVLTGIWNVLALDGVWTGRYLATLAAKVAFVAASGLSAVLHTRARARPALALLGASSAVTAVGALFLGVLLGA